MSFQFAPLLSLFISPTEVDARISPLILCKNDVTLSDANPLVGNQLLPKSSEKKIPWLVEHKILPDLVNMMSLQLSTPIRPPIKFQV